MKLQVLITGRLILACLALVLLTGLAAGISMYEILLMLGIGWRMSLRTVSSWPKMPNSTTSVPGISKSTPEQSNGIAQWSRNA